MSTIARPHQGVLTKVNHVHFSGGIRPKRDLAATKQIYHGRVSIRPAGDWDNLLLFSRLQSQLRFASRPARERRNGQVTGCGDCRLKGD
jgi:hypothetical protein